MSDLPDKLRQTWPLGSFGPLTTAQRELAHEAADYITALETKLAVAREPLEDAQSALRGSGEFDLIAKIAQALQEIEQ